jgi:pSer/pThr/pTyr-binding forkhead associated (FHA) protein/tetratricopeptide (TPR) repeat protein
VKLIVLKNNVPISEVQVDTPDLSEQYEFFVGRADDCHVLIDDPLISRHQFVLKNDGPQWYCEKLTQVGFVSVNGISADRAPIFQGAEIKCGAYSVLVAQLDGSVGSALQVHSQTYAPTMAIRSSMPEPTDSDLGDLAPLEELEETTVIPGNSEPELTMDAQDNLDDNISLSEDEDLGSSDMEQSLVPEDFEQNTESSNAFDSDSANDENTDASQLDDFADNLPVEVEDEKTRVDSFFVNYQLILFGEHAPYDRYQISGDEIFIGRDEKKCQIILNDPEVSSIHAVIRRGRVDMILEDLNSSNGTILNGERINKASIGPGDEFVIGGTSFTLEVQSELLDSEKGRLMPVEKGQVIEREEIEEEMVDLNDEGLNFDSAPVEKSILKRIWKDPAQRKKLIYGLVGAALLFAVLYEEEPAVPKPVVKAPEKKEAANVKAKRILSKELETRRNVAYELGIDFFDQNKLSEALKEFQTVAEIDPEYKKVQSFLEQTKSGLKRLEELEAQRRAEEEKIKIKKEVEEILVKARASVKERQVELSNSLFGQIIDKDPENIEVPQLRMELESWQREQERIALEKAAKEAARKAMVDALSAGKTYYLKKEWYRATLKLEEFLRKKGMDEDLVKEASDMLSDSKNQLAADLGPILGKARSLKEGQDLKNAYETYLEVLRLEPTNTEALNEVEDIRSSLDSRSKKIYREAIIAESLSLFSDAKDKFQEVQQISPTDSDYYKKATEKLKNYLE